MRPKPKERCPQQSSAITKVNGFDSALPRASHTDSDGTIRIDLIEGVRFRVARPVSHKQGYLTEAFRSDWGISDVPVAQINLTVTFAGQVRAWGIHKLTVDRLFAASGSLCIVCYDGRQDSPTYGKVNEFLLGTHGQGLVVIPPLVYHGWKNIGEDEAAIVSMPSRVYDHDRPDRWELPWDSSAARSLIPYQW